jgi:LysM repeat protein
MRVSGPGKRASSEAILLLLGVALLASAAYGQPYASLGQAQADADDGDVLPAEDVSPLFVGMYRKVMAIEAQIIKYSNKYDVDLTLARAVCMYESGGNANLRSAAGARGYFQVMPATFRSLRVRTNIEAGIKYLGQLVRSFNRPDSVLAAYNGGPTRVARGRALPMETKQYVLGVGAYRRVLQNYEPSIRKYAEQLGLATVQRGENWWQLSQRLNVPLVQLRLYNPFLAGRTLRAGYQVAYPLDPEPIFLAERRDDFYYRVRLGDNLIKLVGVLGADLDAVREANGLEPLQPLPPGSMLEIPLDARVKYKTYRVAAGDNLSTISHRLKVDPWSIIRDNALWDQDLESGMVLRIRVGPPPPKYIVYRVRRGDTLSSIARRYRTTVRAIQQINSMGRRTRILIGQRLRIRRS